MRHLAALVAALLAASLPLAAPGLAKQEPPSAPPPATETGTEAPPAGTETPPAGTEAPPARPGKAPREGRRVIDKDSPVAQALDRLLEVDPRYSADGTVELVYEFRREAETDDWTVEGLDRATEAGPRGNDVRRRRNPNAKMDNMALGASASPGTFLHRLTFKGDYEAIFDCSTLRSVSNSDLVFVAGKLGASWGTRLVQQRGHGWAALGEGTLDRDPWTGGRKVTVRLAVKDGELETEINGARRGATRKLDGKSDGKLGIYLSDMLLVVHRATLRGTIDATKL